MKISERLAELKLVLPPVAKPVAAYVPAVLVGNQVITSGQLPTVAGELVSVGIVGAEVSLDQGKQAAQIAVLNALAAAAAIVGGIDKISRITKLVVFVASAPGFTSQPIVANGASELVGLIFGDAGKHARSAVGVAVLPLNAPVEIELVAQID